MKKDFKLSAPVDLIKYYVSQDFGPTENPKTKGWYAELGMAGHNGLDFACPIGVPVKATHDGEVFIYTTDKGGKSIKLFNDEEKIMTLHLHLSKQLVATRNIVKATQTIGLAGDTGENTTGPHLHFGLYELQRNSREIKNLDNGYNGAIDPVPYLARKLKDGTYFKTEFEKEVYFVRNGMRWWIVNEEYFKNWNYGQPINKAEFEVVDLITRNYYKYGGPIGVTK